MICKNCGVQVVSNAKYCQKCGTKITESQEKDKVVVEDKKPEVFQELKAPKKPAVDSKAYHRGSILSLIILAVFFLAVVVGTIMLLSHSYEKKYVLGNELKSKQSQQSDIHNISSEIEKYISAHNKITSRLTNMTESYTSEDVDDVDDMISELTSLESKLKTEYSKMNKLTGEKYEVLTFSNDYTVEDRNRAIREWKESRQVDTESYSNNGKPLTAEDIADKSFANLEQEIAESEADLDLKLALISCQINYYDLYGKIDCAVSSADEAVNGIGSIIVLLWIVIFAAAFLFGAMLYNIRNKWKGY